MAQIALSTLGQVAGNALLPQGISALGLQVSGAAIGGALGGLVGSRIDALLFGNTAEGPRLETLRVMESREGAGVPNVYGRMRVGGQVIWAARLRETRTTERVGGGKGGPRVSNYTYTASFAVALCEGVINRVDRVWANGEIVSLNDMPHRLYRGDEMQSADPLIEAIEGTGCAPAYRGTAYIVFEDLPLDAFGNRLPQLSFEVIRGTPGQARQGAIAPLFDRVTGVNLIPASGEFVYGSEPVRQHYFPNIETPENTHTATALTDMQVSLDQLESDLPLVRNVALTVGWFGDDLRAGECQIRPGVEARQKDTQPYSWRACGMERSEAALISGAPAFAGDTDAPGPNYGGTPADRAVVQGIKELNARGMAVTMSPFLFMDVPPGNGLTDPYGGTEQAAFPWRGRITDTDGTAATRGAIDAFLGTASVSDFELDGEDVNWLGSNDEFGFRRFVLHQAFLAKAAGGVEAFLVGSEMRALTRLRDEVGGFPFVDGLIALADDVRAVLGSACKISYAADWTEYGAYVPADNSGDVLFPLDAFWGDANVDFVGVDWYPPAGDWRDGDDHLDALAGFSGADDADYLLSQMAGGEAFDWFYASDADRAAQVRTPIVDGAHGEHWVFRQKDLIGWWEASHHERPGGARNVSPTDWVAGSKPIRLSEIGFPAVDKGGNSPNLFFDPKSSESALPPFSNSERDDVFQRAALDVSLSYWLNQSAVEAAYVWCWDARPWPVFPIREDIWADGPNWAFGHWLNGRTGLSELGAVISDICARAGVSVDASAVTGIVDGVVLGGVSSLRGALQPLVTAFGLDVIEREGVLVFAMQDAGPITFLETAGLTEGGLRQTRKLLDKVPGALRLTYSDGEAYQPATAEARNDAGDRAMVIDISLPLVLTQARAQAVADFVLAQASDGDEASAGVPIDALGMEAGDGLRIDDGRVWRVRDVSDGPFRQLGLRAEGASIATLRAGEPQEATGIAPGFATPGVLVIDGPVLPESIGDARPLLAGVGTPWAGPVAVSAGVDASTLTLRADLPEAAGVGRLIEPLAAGPLGRWDDSSSLVVDVPGEVLASLTELTVLSGGGALLVEHATGWELLCYRDATLIGAGQYRLTGLLRGLQGSQIRAVEAGAVVVIVDARLGRGNIGAQEIGLNLVWNGAGRGLVGAAQSAVFANKAGLAFAPVHLRAEGVAGGGSRFTWVRRGPEVSDSWVLPEAPNVGRFQVSLSRHGDMVLSSDVEVAEWTIQAAWQAGDILSVAEYGTDGRAGHAGQLTL